LFPINIQKKQLKILHSGKDGSQKMAMSIGMHLGEKVDLDGILNVHP